MRPLFLHGSYLIYKNIFLEKLGCAFSSHLICDKYESSLNAGTTSCSWGNLPEHGTEEAGDIASQEVAV